MRKQKVLENTRILSKLANSNCRENACAFYAMRYTSAHCSTEFKTEMRGILNLFSPFLCVITTIHIFKFEETRSVRFAWLRALPKSQNRPAGLWPNNLLRRTSNFDNEMAFFQECFFMKTHLLPTYYLRFDWSDWIVLIKSEILIAKGMDWPVSSDKWKAPLNCFLNLME